MHHMSIFEIGMLLCFGASWPFAVAKTYKTKDVKSKSILFLGLILLGYVFGIIHKIIYKPDFVIWLYVLNGILVLADIILYFRYKKSWKAANSKIYMLNTPVIKSSEYFLSLTNELGSSKYLSWSVKSFFKFNLRLYTLG